MERIAIWPVPSVGVFVIVGVDTASKRWHAVGRADWIVAPGYMLSKAIKNNGSPMDRLQHLVETFDPFLGVALMMSEAHDEPLRVFCEWPVSSMNGKTNIALGMAAGSLWTCHLKYNLWWHWVNISTWQAMVGISSKDSTAERKAKSKAFAIEHGMASELEEDHYDAGCMAIFGEREIAALPESWQPTTSG